MGPSQTNRPSVTRTTRPVSLSAPPAGETGVRVPPEMRGDAGSFAGVRHAARRRGGVTPAQGRPGDASVQQPFEQGRAVAVGPVARVVGETGDDERAPGGVEGAGEVRGVGHAVVALQAGVPRLPLAVGQRFGDLPCLLQIPGCRHGHARAGLRGVRKREVRVEADVQDAGARFQRPGAP